MRRIMTCLALLVAATAQTQPLPRVAPEAAGFSKEGLQRIDRFWAREIRANRVPGAVVAIARDGKLVNYSAHGFLDKAAGTPMPLDAVFQLASMTKIMASVGEKVSGQRLNDFLRDAVWRKVGMPDTGFEVPADKRRRIARPLPIDPITGNPQRIGSLDASPKFDCAGGCAFGTMGDYLRFGQMLLDGGAIDGQRVLSPKTVEWMTSDHLGANIRNQVAGVEPYRDGYGFGLGVAVRGHDGVAATPGSRGDYTWNGANGTQFWADPRERLVVVVGTAAPGEIRKIHREQMGDLVYGAMTDLRRAR